MGTISAVTIEYSKGRMIRQQPEGHDTFASVQIGPLSRTEQSRYDRRLYFEKYDSRKR